MAKKIISIILVLVWMGLIFSFSNANGESSGSMSRRVIVIITETITNIKDGTEEMDKIVDRYQLFVRKGAHFFIYFVLAFLVMNSLYIWDIKTKTLIISGVICILYAISDELHQYFIAERSGNIIDVMWDSSASLISSYLYYKIVMIRGKNEKRNTK
jgi:VanZ family protein